MSSIHARILRPALAVLVLAAAACSSSDDGSGTPTACSFSISGAVTASNNCTVMPTAAYVTSSNQTTVSFAYSGNGTNSVVVKFSGAPTFFTHLSSASDVSGTVTVTNATGKSWVATVSNGTGTGNFILNITSVSAAVNVSNGATYTVHGTLTGQLPAVGAPDVGVTVSATF